MGTPAGGSALRALGAAGLAAVLLAACSQGTTAVSLHSSSPARTPASGSPAPSGPYGIIADWPGGAGQITVSLITSAGAIAAQARADQPAVPTCGTNYTNSPYLAPPVSTSDSAVYFMDDQGLVRALSPHGSVSEPLFQLALGPHRWSFFSVSPDGQRVAATVVDYTSSAVATTSLFVARMVPNGTAVVGTPTALRFRQTDAYTLWPIGWHGDQLVLAKVPACPGVYGPPYWALELHVVDPATAARKQTIGGPECTIAGPPSAGGVLCESSGLDFIVRGWNEGIRTQEGSRLAQKEWAYISPGGGSIAIPLPGAGATRIPNANFATLSMSGCGWIDDSHVIGGGAQVTVGDISTGGVTTVRAAGVCAGRIPGGL